MITRLRGALTSIDPDNPLAGAAIKQGDPGGEILQFATITVCGLDRHGRGGRRTTRASGRIGHGDRGGTFRLSRY